MYLGIEFFKQHQKNYIGFWNIKVLSLTSSNYLYILIVHVRVESDHGIYPSKPPW